MTDLYTKRSEGYGYCKIKEIDFFTRTLDSFCKNYKMNIAKFKSILTLAVHDIQCSLNVIDLE